MNSELSRKLIVAGGMAVVVGIIAVTFSLRSHHPTSVAQISQPPAAVAQIPDAPAPVAPTPDTTAPVAPTPNATAAVAPTPDANAPVAPTPNATAAVAPKDNVGAKIGDTASSAAVEPKVARNRHPAKAPIGADADRTAMPEATVDLREKSTGEALAKSVDGVKSVDELTIPSTASRTATDAQEGATSNGPAGSDSRITTELKSQFAADSISKDVDIGVTTTQGVVVLTGTLVTQDAIDHVKNVAEKVKDVKSVDTSAMKITST
jgi:hyperosmotically inducible protein